MNKISFIDQLQKKWDEKKFVCVGLDPIVEKLPDHLKNLSNPTQGFKQFLTEIIDSTADLVCCFKPNIAFYEGDIESERVLVEITEYIHTKYPDIPVLVDAKRGDIGNTNTFYAKSLWDRYNFDAATLQTYLGPSTYAPFLEDKTKGLLVLCKTSNPDAATYQDLIIDLNESCERGLVSEEEKKELIMTTGRDKIELYLLVAWRHGKLNQQNPNIGIVVGATHPETFAPIRKVYGEGMILIPGVGTQKGGLEQTLRFAPNLKKQGMIINSSSAIIFADRSKNFAISTRAKALKLSKQIQQCLI